MQKIEINSKFKIGEKVYTIWNRSIGFTCPICNGDGAFLHKGYNVKCTYCYGSGKVFTHEKLWQVDKEPMIVDSMKIAVGKDGKQSIAYTLNNAKKHKRKRPERYCFTTVEEAQECCDILNMEIKDTVENEIKMMQSKYDIINENTRELNITEESANVNR